MEDTFRLDEKFQREETIRRLRALHGALEMGLLLAADALEEAHPDLSSRQWFETLLSQGVKKLVDEARMSGRLAFFSDDEIIELDIAMKDTGLGGEIADEYVARGLPLQEDAGEPAVAD